MILKYCFLLLSASVLSLRVLSIEVINCVSSTLFDVKIENNSKIMIYNPEVSVSFDRKSLSVYEYPETDAVNILINDSFILFTGQMLEETHDYGASVKTSWIHQSNIAGSARLIKRRYGDTTISECEVYIDRNPEVESNPPIKMQIEILRRAAACVRASLCSKLGKITLDDTRNAEKHPYTFEVHLIPSKSVANHRENAYVDSENVDSSDFLTSIINTLNQLDLNEVGEIVEISEDGVEENINKLVDSVIAKIVEKIKQQHKQTMKLPEIKQKFAFGDFQATNGFFSDLSTIRRIADALLSHSGLMYVASGSFGLTKTEIKYNSYKILGLLRTSGSFMAKVTGASAAAAVAIDYSVKPCKTNLQSMHVNKIGHIDISFTGLGPLSHFASTIAKWIINNWQKSLIQQVEETVKTIVQDRMKTFDCEKFRPKIYY